jgi:hypothetical protein
MANFGKEDIGGTTYGAGQQDIHATKFTLSENGRITSMPAYGRCATGGQTCDVELAIYDDSGGSPNNLQGKTEVIAWNNTYAWHTHNFGTPFTLTTGTYWLSLLNGSSSYQVQAKYDSGTSNQLAYRTGSFTTHPDPFGSPSNFDIEWSIYATYDAGEILTDFVGVSP